MRTELIYSFIYNKQLNLGRTTAQVKRDFLKLKEKCRSFEVIYEKNIAKIIRLIPKYTKIGWAKNYIPIYIVEYKGSSFHEPATLKYYSNKRVMLSVLIHELIHINTGWHGYDKEKEIEKITKKILELIS